MRLNNFRNEAHLTALKHGFHDKEQSVEHFKCLIISELMEAVEADRKGYNADMDAFERYDCRITFEENFERHIKNTVADELADACIRIFDLAGHKNIDLDYEIGKTTIIDIKGSFTEKIYYTVHVLVGCEKLNKCLTLTLRRLFLLAEGLGIDIYRHIKLKMQYNQSRPHLHGKRY